MHKMRWQDWLTVVLGVWLCISPWVLGFSGIEAPTWNAVIFGVAIVVLELADVYVPDPWPERVSLPVGLWVAISPMVLGFTAERAAMLSTSLVGVLVVLLSAWAAWAVGGKSATSH